MTNTYIRNNLREHRKRLGLTQRQVADRIGFESTDRISRWEKGLTFPHITNLGNLCRLFKVSPDALYPDLFDIAQKPGEHDGKAFELLPAEETHTPSEILVYKEA